MCHIGTGLTQAYRPSPCGRLRRPTSLCDLVERWLESDGPPYTQKALLFRTGPFAYMADRTGLEPATSGVTGRHSNQLNYRSAVVLPLRKWWVVQGSNL